MDEKGVKGKEKKEVNVWTDECEELLAEWSEKHLVTDGFMEGVKRVIVHGIIVFQYQ